VRGKLVTPIPLQPSLSMFGQNSQLPHTFGSHWDQKMVYI